jgi:hypothetical protein
LLTVAQVKKLRLLTDLAALRRLLPAVLSDLAALCRLLPLVAGVRKNRLLSDLAAYCRSLPSVAAAWLGPKTVCCRILPLIAAPCRPTSGPNIVC